MVLVGSEATDPAGEGATEGGGFRSVEDCCSHNVNLFIICPDIGRRLSEDYIIITLLLYVTCTASLVFGDV